MLLLLSVNLIKNIFKVKDVQKYVVNNWGNNAKIFLQMDGLKALFVGKLIMVGLILVQIVKLVYKCKYRIMLMVIVKIGLK